jgi:predicted transcriptional regulator YdeE
MKTIEVNESIQIVGLELRTTNERAFEEIPKHWAAFFGAGGLATIPERMSDEVYAVYTNFEHPGVDNRGVYSLIIGAQVENAALLSSEKTSTQMTRTTIAPARRAVYSVQPGHPELVGEKWREIWNSNDGEKSYVCDYERYQANGEIDIFVGIR